MNEKIKEIARKCGINVDDTLPGGYPNEQVIVVEAFAQAIIRECATCSSDDKDVYRMYDHFDMIWR